MTESEVEKLSERVSVEEAAKILGMSVQGVREHMKRNLFASPIGEVTQLKAGGRHQYHIYRDMLNRHVGKEAGSEPGSCDGAGLHRDA